MAAELTLSSAELMEARSEPVAVESSDDSEAPMLPALLVMELIWDEAPDEMDERTDWSDDEAEARADESEEEVAVAVEEEVTVVV